MACRRKSSESIAEAQERAGKRSEQTRLYTYNGQLAQADAAGNDFRAVEKELRDLSSQMLSGVKVKYGRDSNEYEMAGGKRVSEIKHHPRKSGGESGGGGDSQ